MKTDPNELSASAIISGQLPLELELKRIEGLSRYQMCWLVRFAEAGHPYFRKGTPEAEAFDARYKKLGGMCPEISKQLNQLGHD
ncbi:hypothetical protein EKK58_00790 [Candidatus Dependentiae bacterium]|nr:MAG: hypothetical protein EKK58_00790 [Candidatus Dependentiae bacterium]